MHGKCTCNCSDAHRGREDDHRCIVDGAGGGEADACRRFNSHTCGKSVPEQEVTIGNVVGYSFKVKPCRCRSWFCENERCLKASGRKLLHRLIPVLAQFNGMLMLTLTVDPKLFDSPLAAFDFLKRRRCVARLMDGLFRAGQLRSKRYFYVVEWQMGKGDNPGTQMPHFHVLVESSFVDFRTLAGLWNKFRPKDAPKPIGNAPGFGHVDIRSKPFADSLHAARYACKYLTKAPEKGYPDWVRNYRGQIKRFSTSRGLLPSTYGPAPKRDRKPEHDRDCPCTECETKRLRRSSVAERVSRCATSTMLVRIPLLLGPGGELSEARPSFEARVKVPFFEVRQLLGAEDDPSSSLEVSHEEWEGVLQLVPPRERVAIRRAA